MCLIPHALLAGLRCWSARALPDLVGMFMGVLRMSYIRSTPMKTHSAPQILV